MTYSQDLVLTNLWTDKYMKCNSFWLLIVSGAKNVSLQSATFLQNIPESCGQEI